MGAIQKIISGDTATIINGSDVHMFQCGQGNNKALLDFLNACEDHELELITSNKAYENYVKRYGELPPDQVDLFDFGMPVYYVATDQSYKRPFVDSETGATENKGVWLVNKVNDLGVSCAAATPEEAEDQYQEIARTSPDKLIKFCKVTKIIHSIEDLNKKTTAQIYKKDLIHVEY